jgi:hypothetical protein
MNENQLSVSEQKLVDMVEFYRTRLSEEQLRLADNDSTIKKLNRIIEQRDLIIDELQKELEEYRVSSQAESSNLHGGLVTPN